MTSNPVPTAEFSSLVYGRDGVAVDDPAEAFHEASRLYPHLAPGRLASLVALKESSELQQTVARSSSLHGQRPGFDLSHGALPRVSFSTLLARRASRRPARTGALRRKELAAVLEAGYSAIARGALTRRVVPSAGALYPLELYVLALDVEQLEPSVLHYDPFRHRLELLGPLDRSVVAGALVDESLAEEGAALLVVTAMLWRTRFKYGFRGYRFALLEAGHVVQNAVLAAAALRLPALPVGGFYDRRLDAVLGADGLDEASIYALLLGART